MGDVQGALFVIAVFVAVGVWQLWRIADNTRAALRDIADIAANAKTIADRTDTSVGLDDIAITLDRISDRTKQIAERMGVPWEPV